MAGNKIQDDPNMMRVRLYIDRALRDEFFRLTHLEDDTMRHVFENMAIEYIKEHGDYQSKKALETYFKHEAKRAVKKRNKSKRPVAIPNEDKKKRAAEKSKKSDK